MDTKKNILIVTPYFPFPINSGGAQAQFHMMNALRKEFNISLSYISRKKKDEDKLQRMWPDVHFHPYYSKRPCWLYKRSRKILTLLKCWPNRNKHLINPVLSHSFEEAIDYGFINFINNTILNEKIEIIQFEFAEYLNMAFAFPDVKRIFVQHEIHFIRNLRFIKDTKLLSPQDYYQFNMLKQQEITAMNACDGIIVLTDIDKDILITEQVSKPIFVSPAVIPPKTEKLSDNYAFNNNLIFLGGDSHEPNYEGFTWFLENIWPQILKELPQIKLQVIGKWRKRHKKAITRNNPNISMLGYVPSIEPYLRNSIMVVPILTGSGMRMKIIDAANNGTPFITTKVGVEGLNFESEIDCFIEDDTQLFAQKVIQLVNNKETQFQFRHNAFQKIRQMHPCEELIQKRINIYKSI